MGLKHMSIDIADLGIRVCIRDSELSGGAEGDAHGGCISQWSEAAIGAPSGAKSDPGYGQLFGPWQWIMPSLRCSWQTS